MRHDTGIGHSAIEPPEPLQVDGVDYWEIEAMVKQNNPKGHVSPRRP